MGAPARAAARRVLPALALLAAVAACLHPALHGGFLRFDDDTTVVANAEHFGFAPAQLAWMFGSLTYGHWQPLTWLSYAVDHALWGDDPGGHRFGNLLLHGVAALLVLALARALLRAARPAADAAGARALEAGALLAALVFALHPLRVETVAWITARRDLVAAVFFLGAVLVHVRGALPGGRARPAAVAALTVASLAAQAWAVAMPVVLLLLEAWPLGRLRGAPDDPVARAARRRAVRFALLLTLPGLAVLTLAAGAQGSAGAVRGWDGHGLAARLLQSGYGLGFYPQKTVLPLRLSPLYPLGPRLDPTEWRFGLGLAAALAVTGTVLLARRRHPALAVAWLAYAAVVAPVLGLFQSGPQLVADRYSYLACVPFALLLGAALRTAVERLHGEGRPVLARAAAWSAWLGAALVLGPLTHAQAAVWRDDVSLWRQAVAVEPGSYFARYDLGLALAAEGRHAEALAQFEVALRHLPEDRDGRTAIRAAAAAASAESGRVAEAEALWRRVLAEDPAHAPTLVNLGILAERTGRLDEALAWWRRATEACDDATVDARHPGACAQARELLLVVGSDAVPDEAEARAHADGEADG